VLPAQVERDALLAAVEGLEEQRVLAVLIGRDGARDVAAGLRILDLDDLGAEVGELQRPERSGTELLDRDDPEVRQWCRHCAGVSTIIEDMDFSIDDDLITIRSAVRELCGKFPGEYWRGLKPDRCPTEFVNALTENGWLAALIPEQYGGSGLSLSYASAILEEICATGGNAGACHAQMSTMGTGLRHGSDVHKERYPPQP